jgi:starch-binding outer membrane protein, SusD/RagB family
MKLKTKNKSIAQLALAGLIGSLLLVACGRSFLDTTNPNALTTDNFPTKIEDLDLLVMDNYGRLRAGFYDAYPQARVGYGVTHHADQGYSDNDFNAGCQIAFNSNSNDVRDIWTKHYENVGKANATLAAIERYRTTAANLSEANRQLLNWREGEVRFLRAWNYYWLINFFGETSFTSADAGRLGVPIITQVAGSLAETQVRRATLGETWNFITSDLRRAETLLANKTWDGGERARAGIWAVKGFLGKVYTYTQKWDSAKIYLKEVIDRSGKRLVPYAAYRDMFNSNNRPNDETLFEINYNPNQLSGGWNNTTDVTSYVAILLSPVYMTPDGDAAANGFGNFFMHERSLLRFGYNFPRIPNESRLRNRQGRFTRNADTLRAELGTPTDPSTYLGYARRAREQALVDPRLWVCGLQPHVDNLLIDDRNALVVKNRFENNTDPANFNSWSLRKFTVTDKSFWSLNLGVGSNVFWLRMADVHLLYAEALAATGENAAALEQINKVRRRAYSLPTDAPSPRDYASLTAATNAVGDPVLGNNPLRYERFIELFGENANWWFDVRRWRIGGPEAAYYQRVTSGPLTWNDQKYALPIPQVEINANPNLQQNPGF